MDCMVNLALELWDQSAIKKSMYTLGTINDQPLWRLSEAYSDLFLKYGSMNEKEVTANMTDQKHD